MMDKETLAKINRKVEFVEANANKPGEWQIAENFANYKIQNVDNFEDFTIKIVDNFPGV